MAGTIEGFVFNFPEAEAMHMKIAANEYRSAFQLFGDILIVTSDGFSLVGALPRFELRDPRTLSAALFTRSLKSLSCALNAILHGYYGVAFTLTRSIYENILIHTHRHTDQSKICCRPF
ncbi:MAG: hypothetical protein M1582_04885 [Actinobacteria bacterium]|nr:hypothetical protein [Actinomycetota bacterium]